MNKWIITWIITLSPLLTTGQQKDPIYKISWQTLEGIAFEKKFLKDFQAYVMFPKFTERLKELRGKIVEVQGYVIPLEPNASWVALSAYPNASCFFCGAAGPASVMTVRFKDGKHKFRVDDFQTFRGKLQLNINNIHEFYYIINDAVEVK